jgi:hypothetical protein
MALFVCVLALGVVAGAGLLGTPAAAQAPTPVAFQLNFTLMTAGLLGPTTGAIRVAGQALTAPLTDVGIVR